MTDRLHWSHPAYYDATRIRHPNGGETSFATSRRLVEWDEERTVAAMERVIQIRSERPCSPRDIARAIFDALSQPDSPDPEGKW